MGSEIGVSAIVLTRNEEDNLRYCLRSLQWCDEIIVVDSDSKDDTRSIAKDEGARVIKESSADGGFDHLRNFGVEESSYEWIFALDADEICPKELADTLLEEAERREFDAFNIPRENYVMDEVKLSSIYPDYQMRFHRREVINYGQDLHTFVDVKDSVSVKDFDPEAVKPILHFGVQSVRDRFEAINRYTSIRAQSDEEGRSVLKCVYEAFSNLFYSLGRDFVYKKGYKKPHQTALTVFSSFVSRFVLYFKKWQIDEKGADEEVLDKINDIREKEVRKYDGDGSK